MERLHLGLVGSTLYGTLDMPKSQYRLWDLVQQADSQTDIFPSLLQYPNINQPPGHHFSWTSNS